MTKYFRNKKSHKWCNMTLNFWHKSNLFQMIKIFVPNQLDNMLNDWRTENINVNICFQFAFIIDKPSLSGDVNWFFLIHFHLTFNSIFFKIFPSKFYNLIFWILMMLIRLNPIPVGLISNWYLPAILPLFAAWFSLWIRLTISD